MCRSKRGWWTPPPPICIRSKFWAPDLWLRKPPPRKSQTISAWRFHHFLYLYTQLLELKESKNDQYVVIVKKLTKINLYFVFILTFNIFSHCPKNWEISFVKKNIFICKLGYHKCYNQVTILYIIYWYVRKWSMSNIYYIIF